jgi:hypothetical protein
MHVKEAQWQYEIGEAPPKDPAEELLRANNKNVYFENKLYYDDDIFIYIHIACVHEKRHCKRLLV